MFLVQGHFGPRLTLVVAVMSALSLAPFPGRAQVLRGGVSPPPPEALDSSRIRNAGRDAQRRFERRRVRLLPPTGLSHGGECDEYVGRFCTWYDEGSDWYPTEEPAAVVEARARLVRVLDSLSTVIPGDDWLLGQRVWYRAEGGDWQGAADVARDCGEATPWWCRALAGFADHGSGRFTDAEADFAGTFALMDPDRRVRWRDPSEVLDGDARALLAHLDGSRRDDWVSWMWTLADPLWSAPGNDRLTAHFARRVVVRIRERARNPFGIRWGSDMEELTLRHGWEVGWERTRDISFDITARDHVVGHHHPEGRDYLPRGDVLKNPYRSDPSDWIAARTHARSLYAPRYAPVLLPMDGQVALFPRGSRLVVVATTWLPGDTTYHALHDHPKPWMDPGSDADAPDRSALLLLPEDGGEPIGTVRQGDVPALMVDVPAGRYVLSAERWSPSRRRAGRLREGVDRRAVPVDVATLSDLLLLEQGTPADVTLVQALPRVLPRRVVLQGTSMVVGWELYGLGAGGEMLSMRMAVDRADRGLFRRLGEALRLVGRARPLTLAWREPGPVRPGPYFRALTLDLAGLDPGRYRVRVEVEAPGRATLVSGQTFRVTASR